jgi:hypothetical protein
MPNFIYSFYGSILCKDLKHGDYVRRTNGQDSWWDSEEQRTRSRESLAQDSRSFYVLLGTDREDQFVKDQSLSSKLARKKVFSSPKVVPGASKTAPQAALTSKPQHTQSNAHSHHGKTSQHETKAHKTQTHSVGFTKKPDEVIDNETGETHVFGDKVKKARISTCGEFLVVTLRDGFEIRKPRW